MGPRALAAARETLRPPADRDFQQLGATPNEVPACAGTQGGKTPRPVLRANERQLIDDAAAILGKTRTEFMIASAHAQAIDVLLDRRLFVLGNARHAAFVDALDNPPAPGPKLRALLRRGPGWASDENT